MPKIYLARAKDAHQVLGDDEPPPHYALESYRYLKSNTKVTESRIKWLLRSDDFLLDSGAFSFMSKSQFASGMSLDGLEAYIQGYIEFINKWNINKFFEMDLDCIMNYEDVLRIRRRIEEGTGKKCIPVWHKSRGMDEWKRMCNEYRYVAIGGIASREIKKSEYGIIEELCSYAHENGCMVHGLGYLPIGDLNNGKVPFDTVDGTSWQGHMRFKKYSIKDGKIQYERDEELSLGKRTWKQNFADCYRTWTEFSRIIE